jgi:hypothetical protein
MAIVDRLRSLDRVALRPRPAAPVKVAAPPEAKIPAQPKAKAAVAPRATAAARPAAAVPVTTTPRSRRGSSPRLRALGWRVVAVVAGLIAMVSTPLGRHGLLGPAIVIVIGAVLTFWWGPVFYVLVAVLTAAVWFWAERISPNDV